ncbi:MAG: hypothetical protein ACYCSO_05110 [Cuniculiplasma sp.]
MDISKMLVTSLFGTLLLIGAVVIMKQSTISNEIQYGALFTVVFVASGLISILKLNR